MKQNPTTYNTPYIGCLLGTAYQRLISMLEKALREAKLDITAGEYLILRALYSRDGLQQCEIADMVGKDKGAISRTVSAMVRKCLVQTEAVSYKCTRVWVTEKGRAIENKVLEIADLRHKALLTLAPESDIEAFIGVLKKIVSNE